MSDPLKSITSIIENQKKAIEAQKAASEEIRKRREEEAKAQRALSDQTAKQSPNR